MTPRLVLILAALATLSGCAVEVMPVNPARLEAMREAMKPVLRGPNAPGAMVYRWMFQNATGYLIDPSKLSFAGGVAKLTKGYEVTLQSETGVPYRVIDGFGERTGPNHTGRILYQFSPDGQKWFFIKKGKWTPSGPTSAEANTALQVAELISKFHEVAGEGQLFVRIFLQAPSGKESAELREAWVQVIAPAQH